jgi:putative intracellular protease/amidase
LDEELAKPKEIFEQNGFVVTIASSTMKEAKSMFGTISKPDVVLHKVKASLYDAIYNGGLGGSCWIASVTSLLFNEAFALYRSIH